MKSHTQKKCRCQMFSRQHEYNVIKFQSARSDDGREDTAEPAPVAVVDNVGRSGNERSVVSVELARLVGGTVDRMLKCGSS